MEAKPDVLILDPVGTLAESAAPILRRNGYAVRVTGATPPSIRTPASPDVAIIDACSLGGQGIPRLVTALRRSGARAVLQVSGCAAVQEACRCHPDRADAYLLRPLYDGELLETVAGLTHGDGEGRGFHGMIGTSPAMRRVFDEIRRVAPTDSVVLITGETGTGKELVARALHALSGRVEGPFVPVDCTALSSSLLESELFGHVRGAFTGAVSDKPGLIEISEGGTLFLDEVGDMPLALQTRLLRVVQERQIRPVGGTELVSVDNRIIAATRRDLTARVAEGTFRDDLYYRLRGFTIALPPLRDRDDDVELLVRWWFGRTGGTRGNGERPPVSEGALGLLRAHRWPGNVRELLATLEYASIRSGGDPVGVEHLPAELRTVVARHDPGAYGDALSGGPADGAEAILAALHESGGNRRMAARRLGISRTTLWRRMKRLDLKAPESALPSP